MSDHPVLRLAKLLEAKMEEINDLLREQRDDYREAVEALTQDQDEPGTG